MSTLQDRLQDVMARQGWTRADVLRISGQSSSVVSHNRGHPAHHLSRAHLYPLS